MGGNLGFGEILEIFLYDDNYEKIEELDLYNDSKEIEYLKYMPKPLIAKVTCDYDMMIPNAETYTHMDSGSLDIIYDSNTIKSIPLNSIIFDEFFEIDVFSDVFWTGTNRKLQIIFNEPVLANYYFGDDCNEIECFIVEKKGTLSQSIIYVGNKLANILEANGIEVSSNDGLTSLIYKVKNIHSLFKRKIIDDDGSIDNSNNLFGNHISLRNNGTATVEYNTNGYYVLTNTTNNSECFIEFPQLRGIYYESFKVTVRSQCTTSNKCPFSLYYYIDDNNWGGVKDVTTTLWTSAKTDGTFSENSTQTGNASNVETITEFLYNATDKTLTVKNYTNGTLKSSKSMSIPVALPNTVKWGTTTTWGNNAKRNVFDIEAEYTLLYAPVLDSSEDITLIKKDANDLSINYPITISNNELVTGCGYLSDGWSNEVDWQLTFQYYTTGDNNGYLVIPKGTDKRDYNGLQQWYSNQLNFYVNGAKPSGTMNNATVLNQWINVKITKESYIWKVYYNGVLKTTFDLSSYASIVDNWTVMCIGLDKNANRNSAKIRNIKVEAL